MKPSDACLEIIRRFEGLRLRAYRDQIGKLTIGYGHTADVQEGDEITNHQAETMLVSDVADAWRHAKTAIKVPLTQGQCDAITSFVFNVGMGKAGVKSGFAELKSGQPSTFLTLLNRGDYKGARAQILTWVYAGSERLQGLMNRRAAEYALFGDTTADFSNVIAGVETTAVAGGGSDD